MAQIQGTPAVLTANSGQNYTPETGSSRLVRVISSLESNTAAAITAAAATLAGVSFQQVTLQSYDSGSKVVTVFVGYILEANIPSGSSAFVFTPTGGTGNQGWCHQLATIVDAAQTGLTNVSSPGTVVGSPLLVPPSGTLTYADGDLGVIAIGHDRIAPVATATDWTFVNNADAGSDAGQSIGTREFSGTGTVSASVALAGGGSIAVGVMWIIPNLASGETLTINSQPSYGNSGVAMSNFVVESTDSASTATVTAAIASGTGSISGTTAVAMVSGVATFSNLIITGSGAHTIQFTATGHDADTTTTIQISAATSVTNSTRDAATAAGGTRVRFIGTGFANLTTQAVLIGGVPVTSITAQTSTTVDVVLPARTGGFTYTVTIAGVTYNNPRLALFVGSNLGVEYFAAPSTTYHDGTDFDTSGSLGSFSTDASGGGTATNTLGPAPEGKTRFVRTSAPTGGNANVALYDTYTMASQLNVAQLSTGVYMREYMRMSQDTMDRAEAGQIKLMHNRSRDSAASYLACGIGGEYTGAGAGHLGIYRDFDSDVLGDGFPSATGFIFQADQWHEVQRWCFRDSASPSLSRARMWIDGILVADEMDGGFGTDTTTDRFMWQLGLYFTQNTVAGGTLNVDVAVPKSGNGYFEQTYLDTLTLGSQPASGTSASPLTSFTVSSSNGSSTATVTATLLSGTGALSGTTSVAMSGGVATFSNLIITGSGAHTIMFSASGHGTIASTTITISAGGVSAAVRRNYRRLQLMTSE